MSVLQSRRYQIKGSYQPLDADLTAVAASGLAAAWTAYTPTITAGTGAFTTVSATGRYLVIGKLTCIQITVTITTNGTAANRVRATLPNTPAGNVQLAGREDGVSGKTLSTRFLSGTLDIFNYDNTYPGASGASILVGGTYENT